MREKSGVRAFWLDGRQTRKAGGTMTLMTRRIDQTGSPGVVIDHEVCSCCQTSAVVTKSGPAVVYRDHSGGTRDISIVRKTKTGWSTPAPVHADGWEFPGCPVNGPSIDADNGFVAVAWFTAAGDVPRVLAAFSHNDGRSFGKPIVVDDANPIGRASVVCVKDAAFVCWLAREDGQATVALRRIPVHGAPGERLTVARTGASRMAGFPRMTRSDSKLLIVWRDANERGLRSAVVAF